MEDNLSDQSTDVAIPSTATETRELANVMGFDPDLDFRKLLTESKFHLRGFRLVPKSALMGVPHVIIGLTFRPGFMVAGKEGDYVSVEAVVADKDTLASSPIKHMLPPGELQVFGNEPVVYNDGGTGIRRTITELLHNIGMIDVGPAKKDENPFDKPYQTWARGGEIAANGIIADGEGEKFRLPIARGLRVSEYEWNGQPAHTWYLG